MPRVVVKFTEGIAIPFKPGAAPDLTPESQAQWTLATEQLDFFFLIPAAADVPLQNLQSLLFEAQQANPGEASALCRALASIVPTL